MLTRQSYYGFKYNHHKVMPSITINGITNQLTQETIDFSWNRVDSESTIALAKELTGNTSVTTLILNTNSICNTGAIALAEVLKGNTILTTIDLRYNLITSEGAVALAGAR